MKAPVTAIELIEAGVGGGGRIRFVPSGVEHPLADIWAQSERVARHLTARVGTGVNVGAFLTNTPACPAVVFGIWRSGNTLVSLPYPGRGADLQRYLGQVSTMTDLADVPLVLLDESYAALMPPLDVDVVTFQEAAEKGGPPCATDGAGGLIQFTSGSLGRPKGVRLTPQALGANILSIMGAAGSIGASPNAASWLPLSHDMGFVGMFLTCVAAMGHPDYRAETLILQTPESFLADPASWLRTCARHRVAVTTAPNFAFELAVRSAPFLKGVDLSGLRVCITGAEKVQGPTLRRFVDTFAPHGLRPEVICPAYGMAEAGLAVTFNGPGSRWTELELDRAALGEGRVVTGGALSYVGNGVPVDGWDVRIAADAGQDVGEVQIRGTSLFSEYLGAERTLTPDGWFPTRDVGFVRDGELFLVGRADETIIVGGQNHYAADIEHAVEHDLVRSGCLAAVPLETGFALLAEPVGEPEPGRLEAVCRELASATVRRAGVRPAMVGFLPRGRLPKTSSGKLQRLSLAAAVAAGTLDTICAVWLEGTAR